MTNNRDTKKIRVLIVDDISETRDNLKKLLFFEDDIEVVGTAGNGREGVEQVGALHPDIVLMDINMPGMDGIAASEAISAQYPNVQVVMMSVQGEADYLRRSMLAGAREFLIKPFSSDELATSIRRVNQLAASRRVAAPPPPVQVDPIVAAGLAAIKPRGCKIIAVYSPKGGSGVTTVAANLAIALREETRQRVAVLDASLQYADVGVLFNLPTNRSITDIAEGKQEPDEDLLNGIMATHSSGVKVLLGPARPEMADVVTFEHLRSILSVMTRMFDYIVVDTARGINEQLLGILDAAEQIILISTADLSAVKNTKLFFEVTDALKYSPEKILLILNKYDGKSGIGAQDIESNIKHKVTGSIPRDDRTANAALTRGIPFVVMQRGGGMSQAIFALARLVKREIEETLPQAGPAKAGEPVNGKRAGLKLFAAKQ